MNMHTTFDAAPSANIIPRATIEQIVKHRDQALELHAIAYDKMAIAAAAELEARLMGQRAHGSDVNSYNVGERSKEKAPPVIHGNRIPSREDYLKTERKALDVEVWGHIVSMSRLETVMDKTAKDQLRQALQSDPPEVTIDNIRATLEGWILSADEVFRRGIAVAFSKLDRRFKSHDGWKLGSRVILTYMFDANGYSNYHRNHEDTLLDIERVFLVLDGREQMQYGHLADLMRQSRSGRSGARQSEFENDYFLLRGYKNGNCHVWFKRDDLLDKVNQLLGEYYGAPIPEEREAEKHTGLNDPKTSLAKNYGFFPTPDAAAQAAADRACLYNPEKGKTRLRLLEPSAGTGNLALIAARSCDVDCVEVHSERFGKLCRSKLYKKVWHIDFLKLEPVTTGLYDRVLMNPPFDRERDIDHVMHALKFLKPDGCLTAIMSAGTEFRQTKKSIAFRALMEKMKASWRDLPEGSFSAAGTNCNTIILRVWNDGATVYRSNW